MIIKKIALIMWNERGENPFRIVVKSYARYRKHGWSGMLLRLEKELQRVNLSAVNHSNQTSDYAKWIARNENDILQTSPLQKRPLVSIVTPTYNTPKRYLQEMLESVLAQTYTNWELCIADDASTKSETLEVLQEYENKYANIQVVYRKTNGHISEASNSALSLASGEYVAFLDHDDTLAPNALYEMVKKLNENPKLKLIYSDEDKIDEKSNRFNPHFKSGWNPDMFFSQNYICHLVFLQKEVVDTIGGFRKGYEGSQDYDLLLRSLHVIKYDEIDRVEKILYHWRAIEGSTAYGSGEKAYAHQAGLKALQDYFHTKDKEITVEDGKLPNTYKVNYPVKNRPLVSILIPTRDGYDILRKCVESIIDKTTYPNYEIIILNNETTCKQTLSYLKKIQMYQNVTVLAYHKAFNYSEINNYGVFKSRGDIIAFVNNDIEVVTEHWLDEMVSHACRKEIGAVGAKLYYDEGTVQHGGVVLGIGGVAGHAHKHFEHNAYGYFSRLQIVQNYSAATAACLVVRKELFVEVGGLNAEKLTVAFNDVDFCLKLQKKGYRNLWTPYAQLNHYESKSRGSEDTDEKKRRFEQEVLYMKKKWNKTLMNDRYYNKNLTKKHENFGINI
ncbi:glycosyltransferase [Sulfurimonas sediminis]|uniref:Glycosyltransferase n=1 Tax=Sulfurimonas sediminis TaxID=2590020 RepID=A0A7M1AZ79_9BACT|nr:glycosyltransferase [Sulfurimonas sediminis]QOP42675.1 glycosyltransferase [Sulfurimonas sediminis]